jgi:hypothetical protein
MLETSAAIRKEQLATGLDVVESVRAIAARDLAPIVQQIDAEGRYPAEVLGALGRAGAFMAHVPEVGTPDLSTAIRAMSAVGEYCLSTSFCMWCQDALGWYIHASANGELKQKLGRRVAIGEALGGTALSNPMKTFFGIEAIRRCSRSRTSPNASSWRSYRVRPRA